jgi:hypothetical protein
VTTRLPRSAVQSSTQQHHINCVSVSMMDPRIICHGSTIATSSSAPPVLPRPRKFGWPHSTWKALHNSSITASSTTIKTATKATHHGPNSASLSISNLALQRSATRSKSCAIFVVLDRLTTTRKISSPCSCVVATCQSHNKLQSSQRASGTQCTSTPSFRSC